LGKATNDFNPCDPGTCMEPLAVALILVSAASHAAWNYVAKGSRDKDSFMLLMNVTSLVTLLPVFIILLRDWSLPLSVVPFIVASAFAEAVYFLALSRAYDAGDLSIVYPVARSAPLFVAVAGAVFLNEPLTTAGLAGILLVLVGVYILHLKSLKFNSLLEPLRSFRGPAFGFALLAALGTTVYSLSDDAAVSRVNPILYDLWLEVAITIVLTPIILRSRGWGKIRGEWEGSWKRITGAGALMRGGYLLVLVAMTLAPVGYLLAFRQISVVIGAILGLILLKEGYGAPRILGSAAIFTGVYIIATLA
jgi:drug/metabolite transporter (DMT)-like permease